jgi:hypothetical protein
MEKLFESVANKIKNVIMKIAYDKNGGKVYENSIT